MNPIIEVQNLSKLYQIGAKEAYGSLRDEIMQAVTAPFRRLKPKTVNLTPNTDSNTDTDLWALKDVSFEVNEGEVVGIIGRNGAGKSTLLKILSRITEPTSGRITMRGRVASLLEVGTGFHPELTGRENIFLNGALLGMTQAEIRRKFDEIVAFSEIEKFLDTPVKRYSSGMYVRLAFAVAAHLEPEILVVDEVLAVGDAQFQKKCLGKMGEVGKEGRTVLFVSHNMAALQTLCSRAIWLNTGVVVGDGDAASVVDKYLNNTDKEVLERIWKDALTAPGNDHVRLHYISVNPINQKQDELITVKTPIRLTAGFWNYLPQAILHFSIVVYNTEGIVIFNTGSNALVFPQGLIWGSFNIPANFLNDGKYTIRLLIVKDTTTILVDLNNLLVFEVHDIERAGSWYGKWIGAVRPNFDWELRVDNGSSNE